MNPGGTSSNERMWVRVSFLVAALATFGCSADRPEPAAPSAPAIETVPLRTLAANTASYRGQTVRVCGRWSDPPTLRPGEVARSGWALTAPKLPGTFGPHSYFVGVTSCLGRRPRLSSGCITGRIAREDGSLDLPENILVGSHVTGSHEWLLHPQCSVER